MTPPPKKKHFEKKKEARQSRQDSVRRGQLRNAWIVGEYILGRAQGNTEASRPREVEGNQAFMKMMKISRKEDQNADSPCPPAEMKEGMKRSRNITTFGSATWTYNAAKREQLRGKTRHGGNVNASLQLKIGIRDKHAEPLVGPIPWFPPLFRFGAFGHGLIRFAKSQETQKTPRGHRSPGK